MKVPSPSHEDDRNREPLLPQLSIKDQNIASGRDFLIHMTRRWPEICNGAQLEITGIKKKHIRSALFPSSDVGIEKALNEAEYLNNNGFNIYFAPNPIAPDVKLNNTKRPKDVDTAGAVFVFADGDDDAASNALLKDLLFSILVRTGTVPGPRVHAYWELAEPILFRNLETRNHIASEDQKWRDMQSGLITNFHSDVQVKNPSRLMRLPGFISHAKDETRVDELVTWEKTGSGPIDWRQLPKGEKPSISERALAGIKPLRNLSSLLPEPTRQARTEEDLISLLEASRTQGYWHNNMLIVTASLVAKGWSDQRICEFCGPYCDRGPADPDLTVMIDGARKKGWGANNQTPLQNNTTTAPDRIFKLIRASDLEYREPEFIIKGLIETDSLAQIFGDSGSGKSFIALDLAACIASGTTFHQHKVKQGAVIYIAGEGHNGIKRRLTAWERHNHVPLDTAPLFLSQAAAQFLDATSAQAVASAVNKIVLSEGPPALIIVDTVARNFGPGDENATRDMSNFVAAMDALKGRHGCTLILVHHTGHSDKDRGRGSAALKAALDTEFRVEKTDDIIRLVNTKMKDAAPPPEMYFRLETVELGVGTDGAIVTSAALIKEERVGASKKRRLTDNERLGISAFRRAAEVSGKLDADGSFAGLHVEDWRAVFYQMSTADSSDSKRKAFNRTRKDLVNHGEMSVKDDVYMLTGEFFVNDHKIFAESLRKAEQARLADALTDIPAVTKSEAEDAERDTGQGGTLAGQVPLTDPSLAGQSGQGSIDPSDVTLGMSKIPIITAGTIGPSCSAS